MHGNMQAKTKKINDKSKSNSRFTFVWFPPSSAGSQFDMNTIRKKDVPNFKKWNENFVERNFYMNRRICDVLIITPYLKTA